MRIGVASDHHGYNEKRRIIKYLKKKKYDAVDFGVDSFGSVDYPEYAIKVGEAIERGEIDFGILFCGTGISMSIAANKVKGVRCAKLNNIKEAKLAILHNDVNCIALGSNMHMFKVKDIVDVVLNTNFSNDERHVRRNEMIDAYSGNLLEKETLIEKEEIVNVNFEQEKEGTITIDESPKEAEVTVIENSLPTTVEEVRYDN